MTEKEAGQQLARVLILTEGAARAHADKVARGIRRIFFLACAMFACCVFSAAWWLFDFSVMGFVDYGVWCWAALVWWHNVRENFKSWRRTRQFIIQRR